MRIHTRAILGITLILASSVSLADNTSPYSLMRDVYNLYTQEDAHTEQSALVWATTSGIIASILTHAGVDVCMHKLRHELSPDTYDRLIRYVRAEMYENTLIALISALAEYTTLYKALCQIPTIASSEIPLSRHITIMRKAYTTTTLVCATWRLYHLFMEDEHPWAPEDHPYFIEQARTHRENNDMIALSLGRLITSAAYEMV